MSRSCGGNVIDPPVADRNVARRGILEAGDHPQQWSICRSLTARQHDKQFAVLDLAA